MHKYLIAIATILVFTSFRGHISIAQNHGAVPDGQTVDNGIYLVRGQGAQTSDFEKRAEDERLVAARRSPDVPDEVPSDIYLVCSTPDVPLRLASDPKIVGRSPQDRRVTVEFAEQLKPTLFKFTQDHLAEQIVIVVGNRAVMSAKIRSPICDGRLEISTCDDDISWLQNALRTEQAAK
jgi:hypothetical protein